VKPALGSRILAEFYCAVFLFLCLLLGMSGCNNSSSPPPPVTVALSSSSASVQAGIGTQSFTATVQNDSQNKGVTWSLSGTGCSGAACGSLSATSSASGIPITYTAPANQPNPSGVTLTATSVSDASKSQAAAITVTPPVSVTVTPPTPINIQFNSVQAFTATVTNDSRNQGVTWTLTQSGSNCSPGCGTLSAASSASGTPINYIGPRSEPANPAVTLTATSVTDTARNAPAGINVTVNPGNVTITLSPKRAAITKFQTQPFAPTISATSNLNVTWDVDTIVNGNSAVGTVDVNGNYTPPTTPGTHTVRATSQADITKSASSTIAVTDLTGVTTYHNDLSRDGVNTHEFALTTATVQTSTFGKLFSCTVDGAIYAQPLWVANLTLGGAKHNVIFVATMHESIYAFDADASPCVTLWHVNLIDSAHGGAGSETSVPSGPAGNLVGNGYGDVTPEVGITGTPVIDPATNILYVVSKSVIPSGPTFFQRLHGIDITTGLEKLNGNKPVTISASVAGTGDGSSGGNVAFDPRNEGQRAGLALVNGVVYVAWASHEDASPYHGWVMGFNKTSLAQTAVYNDSPNGRQGGIWMGGGAPAADSSNNLYVITGNGDYDGVTDYGDSILKLSSTLSLVDSFTPSVQASLDSNDLDLGSGGAAILVDMPGAPAGFQHLLIGGGKGPSFDGVLYVANRDNLGLYTANDAGILQEFAVGGGVFATPAFWQNNVYIAGTGRSLQVFNVNPSTGVFNATPTSQSTWSYGFPGSTPSVSASGATNGIVWAIDSSQYCTKQSPGCGPGVIHAYDATNLNTELWNSSGVAADTAGNAVKFTVPTIANGKVYIGTRGSDTGNGGAGELEVYGLKPN
jgi:hypothetical protein